VLFPGLSVLLSTAGSAQTEETVPHRTATAGVQRIDSNWSGRSPEIPCTTSRMLPKRWICHLEWDGVQLVRDRRRRGALRDFKSFLQFGDVLHQVVIIALEITQPIKELTQD
jgi:hypothetical protein